MMHVSPVSPAPVELVALSTVCKDKLISYGSISRQGGYDESDDHLVVIAKARNLLQRRLAKCWVIEMTYRQTMESVIRFALCEFVRTATHTCQTLLTSLILADTIALRIFLEVIPRVIETISPECFRSERPNDAQHSLNLLSVVVSQLSTDDSHIHHHFREDFWLRILRNLQPSLSALNLVEYSADSETVLVLLSNLAYRHAGLRSFIGNDCHLIDQIGKCVSNPISFFRDRAVILLATLLYDCLPNIINFRPHLGNLVSTYMASLCMGKKDLRPMSDVVHCISAVTNAMYGDDVNKTSFLLDLNGLTPTLGFLSRNRPEITESVLHCLSVLVYSEENDRAAVRVVEYLDKLQINFTPNSDDSRSWIEPRETELSFDDFIARKMEETSHREDILTETAVFLKCLVYNDSDGRLKRWVLESQMHETLMKTLRESRLQSEQLKRVLSYIKSLVFVKKAWDDLSKSITALKVDELATCLLLVDKRLISEEVAVNMNEIAKSLVRYWKPPCCDKHFLQRLARSISAHFGGFDEYYKSLVVLLESNDMDDHCDVTSKELEAVIEDVFVETMADCVREYAQEYWGYDNALWQVVQDAYDAKSVWMLGLQDTVDTFGFEYLFSEGEYRVVVNCIWKEWCQRARNARTTPATDAEADAASKPLGEALVSSLVRSWIDSMRPRLHHWQRDNGDDDDDDDAAARDTSDDAAAAPASKHLYLHHGTTLRHAKSIQKHGIQRDICPPCSSWFGRGFYCTESFEEAVAVAIKRVDKDLKTTKRVLGHGVGLLPLPMTATSEEDADLYTPAVITFRVESPEKLKDLALDLRDAEEPVWRRFFQWENGELDVDAMTGFDGFHGQDLVILPDFHTPGIEEKKHTSAITRGRRIDSDTLLEPKPGSTIYFFRYCPGEISHAFRILEESHPSCKLFSRPISYDELDFGVLGRVFCMCPTLQIASTKSVKSFSNVQTRLKRWSSSGQLKELQIRLKRCFRGSSESAVSKALGSYKPDTRDYFLDNFPLELLMFMLWNGSSSDAAAASSTDRKPPLPDRICSIVCFTSESLRQSLLTSPGSLITDADLARSCEVILRDLNTRQICVFFRNTDCERLAAILSSCIHGLAHDGLDTVDSRLLEMLKFLFTSPSEASWKGLSNGIPAEHVSWVARLLRDMISSGRHWTCVYERSFLRRCVFLFLRDLPGRGIAGQSGQLEAIEDI